MAAAESSSEDENMEKLREAAAWTLQTGAHHTCTDGEKKEIKSNRSDPSAHEEDGNELKTTPEFRSHIAKKLGAMLDSCISEVSPQTSSSRPEVCENKDEEKNDDDEGFRLFSTSLPGKWWKEPSPPPPPKRPPAPSTSDSDSEMEMRLREAAISVSDLIPPSTEKKEEKEKEMITRGEEDERTKEPKKKKKKKKKKAPPEETQEESSLLKAKDEQRTREQTVEENTVKKKKKKKKRMKVDEGEEE